MTNFQVKNKDYVIEKLSIKNVKGMKQLSISKILKQTVMDIAERNFKKVLDLGCGTGRISFFLANKKFEVFATDISKKSLDKLEEIIKKENIDNIKTNICNFKNLGFNKNYFDAVVSRSTLHHAKLNEIKQGINEVLRVLKQNGLFVFDLISQEDYSYGQGKKIEDNTYIGSRKGEEGIFHHYFNLKELKNLLGDFEEVYVYKREYRIMGMEEQNYFTKVFDIVAYK